VKAILPHVKSRIQAARPLLAQPVAAGAAEGHLPHGLLDTIRRYSYRAALAPTRGIRGDGDGAGGHGTAASGFAGKGKRMQALVGGIGTWQKKSCVWVKGGGRRGVMGVNSP